MMGHERIIQDCLALIGTARETGSGLLAAEGDAMTMGVLAAGIAAAGGGGWWLPRLITGLDQIVGIIVLVSMLATLFAAACGL